MKNTYFISSDKNKVYQSLLALLTPRGVKKQEKCLIFGETLVQEFLKNSKHKALQLIHTENQFLNIEALSQDLDLICLERDLFQALDEFGIACPILVVEAPKVKPWAQDSGAHLEVFLPLGDPGNLGTALRSCNAFGVTSVVLTEEACHPYHHKVTRAASGTNFSLQITRGPSVKKLDDVDLLWALDKNGESISEFDRPESMRLLVGEEGGLPEKLKAGRLSIPISNEVESLNAATSLSIALYEFNRVGLK